MLENILVPAGAGVAAGLGVAMPLGAIAALLLREGVVNGVRVGVSAAAGVAIVDTTYCAIAMLTGAALSSAVESHQTLFLTLSGLLIALIGVRQLVSGMRSRAAEAPTVEPVSPVKAFVRFVGLTALNPLTLVYFVSLAAAVTSHSKSWFGPVVFVLAVGLSSLAWQVLIASAGSVFGKTLNSTAVELVGIVASLLIVGLGCLITVSGLI